MVDGLAPRFIRFVAECLIRFVETLGKHALETLEPIAERGAPAFAGVRRRALLTQLGQRPLAGSLGALHSR